MKFFVTVGFLLGSFSLFGHSDSAQGRTAAKPLFLAELSPLRTVMGAPEFRLEAVNNIVAAALTWSQERLPSERADYTDRSQILRAEGLWYPLGITELPIFFGAGLQHEDMTIGRQRERSHITWARTSPSEANDRWVNHDTYISITQSIGYRYLSKSLATASIAAHRDELVSTQSRNEDTSEIYSTNPDLRSSGRKHLRTGVTLQVGIFFR